MRKEKEVVKEPRPYLKGTTQQKLCHRPSTWYSKEGGIRGAGDYACKANRSRVLLNEVCVVSRC